MTAIPFIKASACGNDFLIVETAIDPDKTAELTRRMCDRHNGIGADGVEWLSPAKGADIAAHLINADGSGAQISGNGTRCVAAYLCWKDAGERFAILTGAGLRECMLAGRGALEFEFETAMGRPQVGTTLSLPGAEVQGTPVSMGNPHLVFFVTDFAPDWQARAATIQASGAFPDGVNVEYVMPRNQHELDARFFERGAGETQSSGTGSCASAVAAISAGHAVSPVRVQAQGGIQTVRWDDQVYLRGTARLICRGEFWVS